MKTLILCLILIAQSVSLKICSCANVNATSEGAYSLNVSYQVPSGSSCCGPGATSGMIGEAFVSNSGKADMLDYCAVSGEDAPFFCC